VILAEDTVEDTVGVMEEFTAEAIDYQQALAPVSILSMTSLFITEDR
jgi:hypothetical protein